MGFQKYCKGRGAALVDLVNYESLKVLHLVAAIFKALAESRPVVVRHMSKLELFERSREYRYERVGSNFKH